MGKGRFACLQQVESYMGESRIPVAPMSKWRGISEVLADFSTSSEDSAGLWRRNERICCLESSQSSQ